MPSFSPASCGFGSISHDRTAFFFSILDPLWAWAWWVDLPGRAGDGRGRTRPSPCASTFVLQRTGKCLVLVLVGTRSTRGHSFRRLFLSPPPLSHPSDPTGGGTHGVGVPMARGFVLQFAVFVLLLVPSSFFVRFVAVSIHLFRWTVVFVCLLGSFHRGVGFHVHPFSPPSNGRDSRSKSTVSQSRATPIPLGWISSTMAPQEDPTPIGRAGSVSGSNRWIGPPISPSKRERSGGIDGTSTPLDGSFLRSSPNPTNTKEMREETHEGSTPSAAVDHRRVYERTRCRSQEHVHVVDEGGISRQETRRAQGHVNTYGQEKEREQEKEWKPTQPERWERER
eukprot:scaffold815_cov363-Pavlova_lutheri.AAC.4